ncbi:alpha/beta fold hydrolase [Enterovibrio nigricans]|uniref:Pimeloyl-ACP methyl ester carboxylesterase n=1 Tax=Enterovibrio nigricans DSM 22720 TaxID=1121868 RepID=A0A1T4UIA6_9GAMM|nr:alpha/beta fold hydrolase [Enterovibrio nigricans]PKF49960.1 2-succinyl-6-hydroxy-2,4-cyclohexadiene-1-carboxylate synthase [Enterovibrio nigricans]SKA52201.1 Pimeloyl-ACP methyl ester carboxylesterase [Enterovibrio nigricans DSM 22720]
MKMFTRHGKSMAYQDIGNGPVLLFGHSYLWDSKMWAPQVEVLSQCYRCIVPDLWAHGESESMPAETQSLVDYAADMLALMDHLDIETFSIVGLSVGGMWGAELALQAPSRVKSLVLMDTFVGYEPEITKAKYFGMLDAIEATQSVPDPLIDAITPLFFATDAETANPELVAGFRAKLSGLKGSEAVNMTKVGRIVFDRRDTFDEIEKLTVPTLIMVGAEDKPRSPLESMLMHDAIDGSEYILIPHAGHISNMEQPAFVLDALTTFLSKHA